MSFSRGRPCSEPTEGQFPLLHKQLGNTIVPPRNRPVSSCVVPGSLPVERCDLGIFEQCRTGDDHVHLVEEIRAHMSPLHLLQAERDHSNSVIYWRQSGSYISNRDQS